MSLDQLLRDFHDTGCFRYKNGTLTHNHFESLIRYLSDDSPPHRLYLENVCLEIMPKIRKDEEPITGPITAEEYTRKWIDVITDQRLVDWVVKPTGGVIYHDFSESVTYESPVIQKLDNFLGSTINWQVLELNIYTDYPIPNKPVGWTPARLSRLLKGNRSLNRLVCSIDKEEVNHEASFKELTQVIARHPNLQELDFQETLLSQNEYEALNEVLDINYTLKTISLPTPTDKKLLKLHNAIQARLSVKPQLRFSQEHVTSKKLRDLAELGLEPGKVGIFNLLLKNPANASTLTEVEIDKSYTLLPSVYRVNCQLLKNNKSLLHLDLDEYLNNGKRLGGYLFERAIEKKEARLIKSLLAAKVNPFEYIKDFSFISALFKEKERAEWKEVIVKFLQESEWSELIPQVACLKSYPQLYEILSAIKVHLDRALRSLMNYIDFPLTEIKYRYTERCNEWEKIFIKLVVALKKATKNLIVTQEQIECIEEVVADLIWITQQAPRGLSDYFTNYLNFNPELVLLSKQLKEELDYIKKGMNRAGQGLESNIHLLKKHCDELKNQNVNLEAQLKDLSTSKVKEEVKKVRQENASLKKLYEEEKTRCQTLHQENARLQGMNKQNKTQVKNLLQDKTKLEEKLDELRSQTKTAALLRQNDRQISEELEELHHQVYKQVKFQQSYRQIRDECEALIKKNKEELKGMLENGFRQVANVKQLLQEVELHFRLASQKEPIPEVASSRNFLT